MNTSSVDFTGSFESCTDIISKSLVGSSLPSIFIRFCFEQRRESDGNLLMTNLKRLDF
jgi:hypothetical protein